MLPNKVTICGIPHSVKLYEDHFDVDAHFGQINYTRAEIRISKDATPELQEQALFHETLHAMLVLIGRNDESTDEQLVQALSNAMFQTFKLREAKE